MGGSRGIGWRRVKFLFFKSLFDAAPNIAASPLPDEITTNLTSGIRKVDLVQILSKLETGNGIDTKKG